MSTEKLKVLVIDPMKKPYVKEIDSSLESLQHEVDGYIQVVYPWAEMCGLVCDDEAKLNGKELNRALRDEDGRIYDVVAGTFLIVGLGNEDFISLSEEYIEQFKELFAVPELFIRLNGKIAVIPVEDSEDES